MLLASRRMNEASFPSGTSFSLFLSEELIWIEYLWLGCFLGM
jgi:hypothetical protein